MHRNPHKSDIHTTAPRRGTLLQVLGLLGIVPVHLAPAVAVTSGNWRAIAPRRSTPPRTRLAARR